MALAVIWTIAAMGAASMRVDPSLPGLGVDKQVTVSGLSSGAFMAVQYHISHSSTTVGVASFAGGPFWCANDDVEIALHACMVEPQNIDPSALGFFTRKAAEILSIDPLDNLKTAKVFIYSGKNDTVVVPGTPPPPPPPPPRLIQLPTGNPHPPARYTPEHTRCILILELDPPPLIVVAGLLSPTAPLPLLLLAVSFGHSATALPDSFTHAACRCRSCAQVIRVLLAVR
jgi:hypothetical protein